MTLKIKFSKTVWICFLVGVALAVFVTFISAAKFDANDEEIIAQVQSELASTPTPTPTPNEPTATPTPINDDVTNPDAKPSGNPCKINSECDLETEYCAKTSCTATSGVCQKTPTSCPAEFLVVCSCDGRTYSNECTARMNKANISKQGKC